MGEANRRDLINAMVVALERGSLMLFDEIRDKFNDYDYREVYKAIGDRQIKKLPILDLEYLARKKEHEFYRNCI